MNNGMLIKLYRYEQWDADKIIQMCVRFLYFLPYKWLECIILVSYTSRQVVRRWQLSQVVRNFKIMSLTKYAMCAECMWWQPHGDGSQKICDCTNEQVS